MLAPIENMTDNAFRSICHKYGCDMTFTEMISIEALADNNENTLSRLDFKDNTPTQIQLIGTKEDKLELFLKNFKPKKGFSGFNLNLGCPNPNIIRLGQGCAMIKRISKVKRMIELIKKFSYPISIKLRLGLNEYEKEKKVYLNLIKEVDADFFIVHARHGKQIYKEPADFSIYEECVKTGKKIIANGDIMTKENIKFLKSIGVQGAMIGRAAIEDPLIFAKLKGIKHPTIEKVKSDYIELCTKYDAPQRYKNNILKHMGKKTQF